MLQPKRVKYRKQHRGRTKGMAQRGNSVAFGEYGLMALEATWVTSRQIEAARRAVAHHVAVVKPGRVMFELGGVRPEIAHEALSLAAQKMPIKCKIIAREDVEGAE